MTNACVVCVAIRIHVLCGSSTFRPVLQDERQSPPGLLEIILWRMWQMEL